MQLFSQISFSPCRVVLVTLTDAMTARICEGLDRVLSAPERAMFHSFTLAKKRRQWLAGRLAAKAALQIARPASAERFSAISLLPQAGRSGPPQAPEGWHLSISHSGQVAAAACARHPLGIDIEARRAFRPAVINRFVSPAELSRLAPVSTNDPRLTLIWSLKEAALKARHAASITEISQVIWTGWGRGTRAFVSDRKLHRPHAHGGFVRNYALALITCDASGERGRA